MSGFSFPPNISAFWRGLLSGDTQAEAQAALGVPNLAAPGPIGATTPSTGRFSTAEIGYLSGTASTTHFYNRTFAISGPLIDRLMGINLRGILTSTNVTNALRAFDKNSDTFASIEAGLEGVIEADFGSTFIYGSGVINVLLFQAQHLKIEIFGTRAGVQDWHTVFDASVLPPVGTSAAVQQTIAANFALINVSRLRLTLQTMPGLQARVLMAEYSPNRPNATEPGQYLPLSNSTNVPIFTPTLQVINGTAVGELQPEGVIVKAFDGPNRYRIRVSNTGVISTIQV